ncbi:DUF2207 family protein [Microbacterium sp. 179-I 3D4 NHS]|uniref:DUF2207 family protein n=1 Tax=Microbacterium sp. 179-I 3D4 NHS TaxID=3142381 RepID=UPI0039A384DA
MAAPRILRALATLAAAVGLLLTTPAVASADSSEPLSRAAASAVPASVLPVSVLADVDDFSYASWNARFEVGLDDDGRATLHVTEELVARFPDADQNRGIVRGLATSYENAGLDTRVLSVTDGAGADVPYETETDDGVLYVLTGDDDFVRGLQTYVIEYEMRDVILAADTGVDEFYWDLLPLDSTQPIERFEAEIVFDETLSAALTGASSCYAGASGSTERCTLEGPTAVDQGASFHVRAEELPAGHGVTVAIGVEPGTAVQPSARQPNAATDVAPMFAGAGAAGLSIGSWFLVAAHRRRRRTATGIVVAQYDVPATMPPLLAAALLPGAKTPVPAEIVHLGVHGALRIEEGGEKEQPRLRRLDGGRLPDPLDVEARDALFLDSGADGIADIPTASEAFAARMGGLVKRGAEEAAERGLTLRERTRGAVILQWIAIGVVVIGLALAIWGVASGRVGAIPALVIVAFAAFLTLASSLYAFARHTVLTPEGAVQYEYLQGVREFIRVAEADRLRMLQSYTGAERRQDGSANVVVVYEHLLPFAMLFGMEDEWGRVLEDAYAVEQRGPSWIGDPGSPYLRSSLAAFAATSHSASTYTAPSTGSSSSFGGSSGGGFSGGGGGGGFSGGR